ncbi:hypothetical protein MAR_013033 [Mya arenaria]|uniref:Uncharacterized protein n=1 Tax=Mya arenaria TaxID=6604 RepID=A0ABY7G1F3_MYAAR|nr:hypothetical protein MAR_013033 [Mya arenaria]
MYAMCDSERLHVDKKINKVKLGLSGEGGIGQSNTYRIGIKVPKEERGTVFDFEAKLDNKARAAFDCSYSDVNELSSRGKSTHVSNQFKYPIWVKCDSERIKVNKGVRGISGNFKVGSNVSANAKFKEEVGIKADKDARVGGSINYTDKLSRRFIEIGFTRFTPDKHTRFDVDCKGTDTVYIWIYYNGCAMEFRRNKITVSSLVQMAM